MNIIYWPDALLKPASRPMLSLAGQSTSGGRALSGIERVRVADAPVWRMAFPLRLRGSAEILTWRAILAKLKGRSNVVSIPVYECGRTPGALPDFVLPDMDTLHDDDAEFSDGSSYAGTAWHGEASAALAARATAATLDLLDAPEVAPWPGMYFSFLDRLHVVESAGEISGGTCAITFTPPLREAVPAGTPALFDGARGLWRLADDQAGALPIEPQGQTLEFTVSFVEALEAR